MMTNQEIEAIALASGFTLKEQPDGSMALHPHVFTFALLVQDAVLAKPHPHTELIKQILKLVENPAYWVDQSMTAYYRGYIAGMCELEGVTLEADEP
jgi:hypothetical protein